MHCVRWRLNHQTSPLLNDNAKVDEQQQHRHDHRGPS